ncbi:hypothetical protein ACERII_03765 [Evansella sp. AB-rgal1]|uniref:hypothetical protein n=1 Tax=Evansella sp. AB-rgal1 TaxID=3242696 RepID=UPI00359E2927
MIKNIKYGTLLSLSIYVLIALISILYTNTFDLEIIKMWGFGVTLLLFFGSFPFYQTVYHAGKVSNPTYTVHIPPDEHLHDKVQKEYENTKKRKEGNVQGILISSAAITLLITILLAVI